MSCSKESRVPSRMFPHGRGGCRHKSAPHVEDSQLLSALGKHKDLVADLKTYERLGRNQAPSGQGLMEIFDLLWDIVLIAPECVLPPGPTKTALTALLLNSPRLNVSPYNSGVWVGLKLERLTTVLYHVRKLKREHNKFQQVAMTLNGDQLQKLVSLLDAIKLEPEDNDNYAPTVACSERSLSSKADNEEPSSSSKTLKKQASEISVDDQGFPRFLSSSPKSDATKHKTGLKRQASDVSVDAYGYPKFLGQESPVPASSSSGAKRRIIGKTSPQTLVTTSTSSGVEVDINGYPRMEWFQDVIEPPKRPAKAKAPVKEKPAQVAKPRVAREAATDSRCPVPHESELYSKMWHKQNHSIGIRSKVSDKQILAFGIRGHPELRYELELIAIMAMKKLEQGNTLEDVKAWAAEAALAVPR